VRIPPASMAFTLLMSFLVALPSFGIDMSLPALKETAVSPSRRSSMGPLPIDMAESLSSCSRACSSSSRGSAVRWPSRCRPS
jgi:hypothetical protein